MQTHSPCCRRLPEKLINQPVALQMRLRERDLPARALFRQSQNRTQPRGQTELSVWAQGPSLMGTLQSPAHSSIPILPPHPEHPCTAVKRFSGAWQWMCWQPSQARQAALGQRLHYF